MSIHDHLAFFLARPRVAAAVIAFAARTPYEDIWDDPLTKRSLYMGRTWLLKERAWLPIAIRVHHIAREDRDRDLHDHPADYRTYCIIGGYVEQDIFNKLHLLVAGQTAAHRAEHFHKITQVTEGGVWTVFVYNNWRKRNPWGFLKGDAWGVIKVPWKKYLELKEAREAAKEEEL